MNFILQSLMPQEKAASACGQPLTLVALRPKKNPTRCRYCHGNTKQDSNGNELKDQESPTRRRSALEQGEPA